MACDQDIIVESYKKISHDEFIERKIKLDIKKCFPSLDTLLLKDIYSKLMLQILLKTSIFFSRSILRFLSQSWKIG